MATTVETPTVPLEGEKRFLLPGIGWEGYLKLLEVVGDGAVRITYDRGDAELMSPLFRHERGRSRLSRLVEILADEVGIPFVVSGATTLKRKDLDRGLEADTSFYLGDLGRIRRDELDMERDPPPDLAIEIEITQSVLPRLGIYGALGVPEVWRFDGERVRILVRQDDGSYREVEQSSCLPMISLEEIQRFVDPEEHDDRAWGRTFRRWVCETMLPRVQAREEGE